MIIVSLRELGSGRVRFDVRLSRNRKEHRVTVEAPIARRGRVRPSSGELEARIFVAVKLRIGPVEREIELSLVDRGRMIFRMLIGRRALAQAFLVDPSRRYLLQKPTASKAADAKRPTTRRTRERQGAC